MRKVLPCFLLGMLGSLGVNAQEAFTIQNLNLDIQKTEISAVDIDGDGDRDLLLIGENPDGRFAQLYRNDGEMTFTPIESPVAAVALATVDWGDVNGDGQLDMVQSGFGTEEEGIRAWLFNSDAEGSFTRNEAVNFPQMAPTIGMADLNNDGHTDVYVFGNHFEGKSNIFFNDGEGGFTQSAQFDAYTWIDPQVYPVDYDNDGDLDLFVMAGYEEGIDARFARIFVNDKGTFTETDPDIIAKGFGHAEWGDYDGDGDLDLLINGDGYVNSGEDDDFIYRLYNNDGGDFTEAATFTPYRQNALGNGSRFADWDNDGDLDIILTGWNPEEERQATAIFLNEDGSFTAYEQNAMLPGVSESAVEVADLDNDSDLDLILSGYSGNDFAGQGSAFNTNVSLVVENPTNNPNNAPAMPEGLSASINSDMSVTFSWDAPEDDTTPQASLTYNLYLVNKDGTYLTYPLADTTTGRLSVQRKGNVQLNTSWTVYGLPEGEYRWGVQAIDNSFAGSEFAKEDATVSEAVTGIWERSLLADMKVYPNPSKGQLTVKFGSGESYQLNIFTLDGRQLKKLSAQGKVQLNMAPGLYLVQATNAKGERGVKRVFVK